MFTYTCPNCGRTFAASDLNIEQGVALCRNCGKLSRLADLAEQSSVDPKTVASPPEGCSYEQQLGGGAIVRALLRSLSAAAGLLFACLFWNGITSVFVVGAVGGLYTRFIGPLPHWLPGASSFSKGNSMSSGMALGMLAFMLPFIGIGLMLFLTFLNAVMGRVEIDIVGSDGRVRTGIGPFTWTRRFDASQVKRVVMGITSYSQNNQRKPVIQIESNRTIKFGSMLPDQRRGWMLDMLHLLLVQKQTPGPSTSAMSPFTRS